MKKQTITMAIALCLMVCSGCSDKSADNKEISLSSAFVASDFDVSEESEISETSASGSGISYQTDNKETPSTSSSSLNSPLGLNEWGIASKYCLNTKSYVNVPVRIVSVKRGNEAEEEIKKLGAYIFDNRESEEYAIAEYEICLNDFPAGKNGTWCDISGSVTSLDGNLMKLDDGTYWGSSISFFTEDKDFYYDGIVHSKVYFSIIKDRTDYLLCIGESGETVAYFKPE